MRMNQPEKLQQKAENAPENPIKHATTQITPPITNYTLSTVCPACTTPTYRRACKVRCPKCGFMWDCSEL
ncbi:MAG: hypothetical protein RLP44_30335 [Aggregatilineales bacterium]